MSSPPRAGRLKSIDGWRSLLAICVTGGLMFLALSGLWVYLGPFSRTNQMLVLGHVLVGLLLAGPLIWYAFKHWSTWWRQKMTAEMLLGYALLVGAGLGVVSGLVLSWQAGFGLKLGELWDLLHLVAGIGILALLAGHVILVWIRRRGAAARDAELHGARRRFARGLAILSMSSLLVALAAGALVPEKSSLKAIPEDYVLPAHLQEYDEYRGSPFAPTNARTASGQFIEPEVLAGSESCGTSNCHEQILNEWLPSAHRFAAANPPFQQVQKEFAEDREPAETRYCAGCHDPISLFAGAKDIHNQSLSAPGMNEGISCAACHSISHVDEGGNADYVVTAPRKYIGEGTAGISKWLSDFLIRAYPRQHLADYDRNLLRTPEFCAACHKQFIPEALNRFGLVAGQNQYDEWRNSPWNKDDPEQRLECRDCHMRIVTDSTDPGHGEEGDVRRSEHDGAHRRHGYIATNVFMPAVMDLPNQNEHRRLTEEWIRGETILPEIDDIWPRGPVADLEISAPETAVPGQEVEILVVVENRKAGHNFITGPLDFIRSWVHLSVRDADGVLLEEWGAIDPETRQVMDRPGEPHEMGKNRDEGTLVLEGSPIDEHGNVLERHQLWRKAGGQGKRVIFPRYSDAHKYRFQVPIEAVGPLTIDAELNYRRYRQRFLDLVLPHMEEESGVYQPTITQVERQHRLELAEAKP